MNTVRTLLATSVSLFALGGGITHAAPPGDARCTMTAPVTIDMTKIGPQACSSSDGKCLKKQKTRMMRFLRVAIPEVCRKNIDVYVPGTAAEDGAWKQFNHMFGKANGRGHIVIQYGAGSILDMGLYDKSVKDAYESLGFLLAALKTTFKSSDVDVFGHSKGSHAVAMAAGHKSSYVNYAQFFAFAQPGRTNVDIDGKHKPLRAAKLGRAGYIQKLSNNLVGITWANDEVYQFRGVGTSGLVMPESWGFPGNINTTRATGTINPVSMRIDHHNNYGGNYTDGVKGNNPRRGDGAIKAGLPYCATGSKKSWKITEWYGCSKRQHTYVPWFWGNKSCEDAAYNIMNGKVGGAVRIGNSGPRGANCSEGGKKIRVSLKVKYQVFVPDDKDCDYRLRISLKSPDGKQTYKTFFNKTFDKSTTGGWKYSTNEKDFKAYKVTADVPNNFRVHIDADMLEDKGYGDCQGVKTARALIRYVKAQYVHPITNKTMTEFIVRGGEEGDSYLLQRITGDENVAWHRKKSGRKQDTWDLYWDKSDKALKISGMANDGQHGSFYKPVFLMD